MLHALGSLHFLRDFDSMFPNNAIPIAPIDAHSSQSPEAEQDGSPAAGQRDVPLQGPRVRQRHLLANRQSCLA